MLLTKTSLPLLADRNSHAIVPETNLRVAQTYIPGLCKGISSSIYSSDLTQADVYLYQKLSTTCPIVLGKKHVDKQTDSLFINKLPGEIRNRIYHYAAETTIVRVNRTQTVDAYYGRRTITHPYHQPRLSLVCRQLRREVLPLFYADKRNSFVLDEGSLDHFPESSLCNWLDSIGERNAASLHNIQYSWLVPLTRPRKAYEPGLRPHVTIRIKQRFPKARVTLRFQSMWLRMAVHPETISELLGKLHAEPGVMEVDNAHALLLS